MSPYSFWNPVKKKSLHYLAFALRVIIPRQHHHLRNLSSVVSFEQCISVIHYKSTSLWWYITQKMGTSGKNESGNRFSVIGFIWGYKPGYCYLKRCSAWPRATSTAKARKPLTDTTKPKPTWFFPSFPWGQWSLCCSLRDGLALWITALTNVSVGTRAWEVGDKENSCERKIAAYRRFLSFSLSNFPHFLNISMAFIPSPLKKE